MRSLGPAIKVGLTAVVVTGMAFWSFSMLTKGSGCGEDKKAKLVHAYFVDATGLVEKSRVQVAGLDVGHIVSRHLEVSPPRKELVEEKRYAKVTVALDPSVKLFKGAMVYKRQASLLGQYYLEIDPGQPVRIDADGRRVLAPELVSGDEIITVVEGVTTDMIMRRTDRLMVQVNDIIPILKAVAGDVRQFTRGPLQKISKSIQDGIDENRDNVRQVISNIEGITSDVRNITRGADSDVNAILADIKQITSGVRALVGRGDSEVEQTATKVKSSLDKLASAIDKLDSALTNVDKITSDLQEGKGTAGRLLKDDELVNDVEGVVQDAGGFVRSLTGIQTIVGLRTEFNFAANSIKSYVSVEIRPRPDKYYLIELIDDPRGARSVTKRLTVSNDPSQPAMLSQDIVEVTDAFRFTFQFARRLSFATFRFGIKESTGGVGVDLHGFGDRLSLQSDFFDFGANVYPRLKSMLAFEFWKRLYVVGGVDDVLNNRPIDGSGGGRDYFAGFQVRFNDEDLKGLLLFGGGALGGSAGKK